ncbi:hypothetical protein [Luteirhabdus pelagi]|uniref:hypothetical protein n=1 Tax=Luteirhabdus pelagi TaxID=2792783 RepID=UPI00193A7CF4|nr:hypothetical protein [Luteirhabdus pelagi]
MKPASIAQIRKDLTHRSPAELEALVLRMAKFKKENKELLSYLLFDSDYEPGYIDSVKRHLDEGFETVNTTNYYYAKKTIRKLLRQTKKYIRYSQRPETEVELLLYFCRKLQTFKPSIFKNKTLTNLYNRQLALISKRIEKLHEDLQHDYSLELEQLQKSN